MAILTVLSQWKRKSASSAIEKYPLSASVTSSKLSDRNAKIRTGAGRSVNVVDSSRKGNIQPCSRGARLR